MLLHLRLVSVWLLLSAGLISPLLSAQPEYQRPAQPADLPARELVRAQQGPTSHWTWAGQVDYVRLDKAAALSQGLDDSATALGFTAQRYRDDSPMSLSMGLNVLLYNDNSEFAQYVRDYWGDLSYSESDATALMAFIDYGAKYRFGEDRLNFSLIRVGATAILASSRSINNCNNCYSEDIVIHGGPYGVLGLGHTLGDFDVSLEYQQYFGGDLNNSLRLKIAGMF